jgi:probable rRNA maturation factor
VNPPAEQGAPAEAQAETEAEAGLHETGDAAGADVLIEVDGVRLSVLIQRVSDGPDLPADREIARWAGAAVARSSASPDSDQLCLSLRLVDEPEGAELNLRFRGKGGATNVLSFPHEPPDGLPPEALASLGGELEGQLGDLVICTPVLRREAAAQRKALDAHTAHLVVHGTLHLLGYDHGEPEEASVMETLETDILAGLGFASPYAVTDDRDTEPL